MQPGTRSTSPTAFELLRRRTATSRGALLALVLLAHGSLARAALPPTQRECIAAAEQTQSLRDKGRLRAARAQALLCSRAECPTVVRHDCDRWVVALDDSLPTAVVRAVDALDRDVTDVRVTIDGELLLSRLDGMAVPIDPGTHHFVYSATGHADVAEDLLIAEGEKNRRILVRFADTSAIPQPSAVRAETPQPRAAPEHGATSRALDPAFLIASGVAAVGLASFAYFGIGAIEKKDDLASSCAPIHACSEADHDSLRSRALAADISLGITLAASAVAVWLFLRSRPDSSSASTLKAAGASAPWSIRY